MITRNNLVRFLEAQADAYQHALAEIKRGKKTGHWMWFIFPQIRGLGSSEMSSFYAIADKNEAAEYLQHDILGTRLVEISNELLRLPTNDAVEIFGHIDSLKLRSSMTPFSALEQTDPVFQKVLNKFFAGKKDDSTLRLLT